MTRGYAQFCPVAKAAEVIGERWTPLIVRELIYGSTHFGELLRGMPTISPALLSLRLKSLEQDGILERREDGLSGTSEYVLTPAGRELGPVIEALGVWGRRWRGGPEQGELDPGLLMWELRRRIDIRAMPPARTVLRFELVDAPRLQRRWWLVALRPKVELHRRDPRHEADLTVTADLRTLTAVWSGDLSLSHALASGQVRAQGRREIVRALPSWIGRSPFSGVRPAPDGSSIGEGPPRRQGIEETRP
jgi:DNA-binding HxlR family transcriptional regulator